MFSFFKRRFRCKATEETIHRTLDLADEMLNLADEGEATRDDVNGGVLFGVVRDSAYKIRRLAESTIETNEEDSEEKGTL